METFKNPARTVEEEMSREQKFWKKNHLWTLLVLAGVVLWSLISGPGLSVAPGSDVLTLTDHNGKALSLDYSSITEVQLLEDVEYGTLLEGADQRSGKSGTWEHSQWGRYTLCVYASCPSAVRILTEDGCYVVNLASEGDTQQL